MEKFTPGPWIGEIWKKQDLLKSIEGILNCSESDEVYMLLTKPSDQDDYAIVAIIGNGPKRKENGLLIQEAPDMLAALKAMLTPPIASREAIAMAEKAIKKAEGSDA